MKKNTVRKENRQEDFAMDLAQAEAELGDIKLFRRIFTVPEMLGIYWEVAEIPVARVPLIRSLRRYVAQ